MYEKIFKLEEEVFKVLANHKRLEIIQLLSHGQLCVSDMIDMLGLAQANLSQHLSVMHRAGLLRRTRRGTKVYYSLISEEVAAAVFSIREFLINTEQLDEEDINSLSKTRLLYPVAADVVCGMRLSAGHSSYHARYGGEIYTFCASGCLDKFRKSPEKYVTIEAKKGGVLHV